MGVMRALVVSPLVDGRTWVLVQPFWYEPLQLEVPVRFITDFASVPRPLWWLFPQWGRYGPAAVVHDFTYKSQLWSRKHADRLFMEGMKAAGCGWLTRSMIHTAVRLFGWLAWRKAARNRASGVPLLAPRLPLSTDTRASLGSVS